jgi:hypothetical protein
MRKPEVIRMNLVFIELLGLVVTNSHNNNNNQENYKKKARTLPSGPFIKSLSIIHYYIINYSKYLYRPLNKGSQCFTAQHTLRQQS